MAAPRERSSIPNVSANLYQHISTLMTDQGLGTAQKSAFEDKTFIGDLVIWGRVDETRLQMRKKMFQKFVLLAL